MAEQQQQNPLDYRASLSRPPVTSVGMTIYLGILVAIAFAASQLILPRLEAGFADFNTKLPMITVIVLGTVRWLTRFPGMIVFLLIPVVVPMLISRITYVKDNPGQTRTRVKIMSLAVTLITAGLVVAVVLALFLPMIALINSVSGHN